MYMSYCRNEGICSELNASLSDASSHVYGEAEYEVSDREIEYFKKMIRRFADWLGDMDLLDEDGCLDEDRLEEIGEAMSRAGDCDEEEEDC